VTGSLNHARNLPPESGGTGSVRFASQSPSHSPFLLARFARAEREPLCGGAGVLQASTPCGTRQYMAPEIVGEYRHSLSVDMWSVGCIAFLVLSGCFPFSTEDDTVRLFVLSSRVHLRARHLLRWLPAWRRVHRPRRLRAHFTGGLCMHRRVCAGGGRPRRSVERGAQ